jgi:hypothetical protein
MPYRFQPGKLYRMPTHFGPSLGPRQGPDDRTFACRDTPKTTTRSVRFLTHREQLEELLPAGFTVGAEPVVTIAASYMTEIEWLAGRGYNTLGVSFPAIFQGERDRAEGSFLAVLWENLTDPILTGREELGFSKIYCELPEPRIYQGEMHCIASWLGFTFLDLTIRDLHPMPTPTGAPSAAAPTPDGVLRGTLHYKFMPATQAWGHADAAYAVLTPAHTPNTVLQELWQGEGTVTFHRARWEDLPTQFHIVNALQELEIREYRGATVVKTVGGKDLSDQRVLR